MSTTQKIFQFRNVAHRNYPCDVCHENTDSTNMICIAEDETVICEGCLATVNFKTRFTAHWQVPKYGELSVAKHAEHEQWMRCEIERERQEHWLDGFNPNPTHFIPAAGLPF